MPLASVQRLLRPLLSTFAVPLYAAALARRNRAFDAGKGVVTLDRPVISVGNLSAGGTGKSPMVAAIIRWLLAAGHTPCIAMRGYGAPPGQGHRSDEALEYRSLFPSLPIVAQPNRIDGLLELFAKHARQHEAADDNQPDSPTDSSHTPLSPSVIVLDDGFQHRQLARQLDLVLIDATKSPFEDRLLPAGLLREPVKSLRRAQALVITRSDAVAAPQLTQLIAQLSPHAPQAPIYLAQHHWPCFERTIAAGAQVHAAEPDLLPTTTLASRRLFAACAIGNPQAFLSQLAKAAALPAGLPTNQTLILPDHDPFAPATIGALLQALRDTKADALVVTRKDWVKLTRVKPSAWPCDVLVPQLELHVRPAPHSTTAAPPLEDIMLAVANIKIEEEHQSE